MRFDQQDLALTGPPAGRYRARILAVDERESENGNELVVLQLEVLDGDWMGERLRDFFVIAGRNPCAVRIGKRRLASVFHAVEAVLRPGVEVDLGVLRDGVVDLEVTDGQWLGQRVPRVRSYHRTGNKALF